MAVGEEQTFSVEIANTGDVAIPELRVVLRIDEQFQLTQTRYQEERYGFQRDPVNRTFNYVFKNLQPKESLNKPLDFVLRAVRQTAPNQQARIDVTVTAGGVPLADQKLLAITPPRAASATAGSRTDLALTRDNPPQIQLGTRQKISIVLSNSGSVADKNVQLLVSLPDLVTFQETDITSKVRMSIEGNVVRFDPLPELPAGQSVLVTIGYQAAKVGTGQFTARFVSQEQPQGQTRTENLQVFDNP
ncbi:MAG: hypothetical protein SFX18_12125 [Pirellulales bacterium]|nr:hypothetical protein [Pirellulales bacterium]